MAHDDRFFTLVCCAALIITGVLFLWTHNGLISFDLAGSTLPASAFQEVDSASLETTHPTSSETLPVTSSETDEPPAAVHAVFAEPVGADANSRSAVVATFSPEKAMGVVEAIGQQRLPQISGFDLPAPQEILVRRDGDGRMVVAPGTHRRYERAREAITGLDGPTVAAACDVLEHSFANGLPGEGVVREKVIEAIDVLLAPEMPEVELDMVSRGSHWGFADPGLDDLAPVQKHMLLMGIDNQRAVRTTLQDIRRYLGGAPVAADPALTSDAAPDLVIARADVPGERAKGAAQNQTQTTAP